MTTTGTSSRSAVPSPFAHYVPTALANVRVPAYVLDRQGRVRWLNPAARELVGDAEGMMFTSLVHGIDARTGRSIFERNLRGAPHPDYAVDLVSPAGDATRVEISSTALGREHHAVGVFGLAIPITPPKRAAKLDGRLTQRQLEVLSQLAEGSSTEQIARLLHLSPETVRNHVRHILQRLGASSRLEAVAIAHRDGLV